MPKMSISREAVALLVAGVNLDSMNRPTVITPVPITGKIL